MITYAVCDDAETLVWLANLAALELHVPQWTLGSATPAADGTILLPGSEPRPGEPLADRVVVDLDPGEGMTILDTARAALLVAAADGGRRSAADAADLGQQGDPGLRRGAAQPEQGRLGLRQAAGRDPGQTAAGLLRGHHEHRPAQGRIYVDYNQNLAARNTIAPYSMRGRERPAVATPVTWEEVGAVQGPDDLRFSPDQVVHRVAESGDLAADLLSRDRPPLPAA